eukprot:2387774-Alexandrium_andersonii.AAC.1
MDTILTMENEFEVFLHAHYPNLWKFTLVKAYDRVARERIEVSANLLEKDTYLQDENLSAEMARDFLCNLMQIVRRDTERRRQRREFFMIEIARR